MNKELNFAMCGSTTEDRILPNIAIIEYLNKELNIKQTPHKAFYLSNENNQKNNLIKNSEINFHFIKLLSNPEKNFLYMFMISIINFFIALFYLKKNKIKFIVSSCESISIPIVTAGVVLGTKIYAFNFDNIKSNKNRYFEKICTKMFLANEDYKKHYNKNKIINIPFPLREKLLKKQKIDYYNNTKKKYSIPQNQKVIFLFSNIEESEKINNAFIEIIPQLLAQEDISIIFATGRSYSKKYQAYESTISQLQKHHIPHEIPGRLIIKEYFEDINAIYSISDLIVSSAKTARCNEILSMGIPAIFIPYLNNKKKWVHNLNNLIQSDFTDVIFEDIEWKQKKKLIISEYKLFLKIKNFMSNIKTLKSKENLQEKSKEIIISNILEQKKELEEIYSFKLKPIDSDENNIELDFCDEKIMDDKFNILQEKKNKFLLIKENNNKNISWKKKFNGDIIEDNYKKKYKVELIKNKVEKEIEVTKNRLDLFYFLPLLTLAFACLKHIKFYSKADQILFSLTLMTPIAFLLTYNYKEVFPQFRLYSKTKKFFFKNYLNISIYLIISTILQLLILYFIYSSLKVIDTQKTNYFILTSYFLIGITPISIVLKNIKRYKSIFFIEILLTFILYFISIISSPHSNYTTILIKLNISNIVIIVSFLILILINSKKLNIPQSNFFKINKYTICFFKKNINNLPISLSKSCNYIATALIASKLPFGNLSLYFFLLAITGFISYLILKFTQTYYKLSINDFNKIKTKIIKIKTKIIFYSSLITTLIILLSLDFSKIIYKYFSSYSINIIQIKKIVIIFAPLIIIFSLERYIKKTIVQLKQKSNYENFVFVLIHIFLIIFFFYFYQNILSLIWAYLLAKLINFLYFEHKLKMLIKNMTKDDSFTGKPFYFKYLLVSITTISILLPINNLLVTRTTALSYPMIFFKIILYTAFFIICSLIIYPNLPPPLFKRKNSKKAIRFSDLIPHKEFIKIVEKKPETYKEKYKYKSTLLMISKNKEEVKSGIKLIGIFKEEEKIDLLLSILGKNDINTELKNEAMQTITKLNLWNLAIKDNVKLFLKSNNYNYQKTALINLEQNITNIKDYQYFSKELLKILKKGTISMQIYAMKIISKFCNIKDYKTMIKFYFNPNYRLRELTLQALYTLHKRKAITKDEFIKELEKAVFISKHVVLDYNFQNIQNIYQQIRKELKV